ncbi:MAG: sensor histidine kinase [Chloroflexi bacterium]|nr:sensor histidine kinase [Chloroflexota bacterium]
MQNKKQFVGFPFYIFISVLLGMIAVLGLNDLWKSGATFHFVICILLFLAHIGLYWLNLYQFQSERWWVFYYFTQTLLVIALVSLPYGTNIHITLLGSALISLIAESLGLWGNTRRALYLGLFFLALLLVMLYRLVAPVDFGFALSTLLINGGFIVLFMVVLNQQLAERQKAMDLAESLESANAKLAASAAKIESLTLQNERQRMARELHDTLAQGVAGLVLQLEAVKAHLGANRAERAAAIVEQALTRARSTLAESRAAIDDLRAAPANLAEFIREKIDRFTQATGIPCEMEISVNENQLSPETMNHTLNVLGEALTNIVRHAQATKVQVKCVVQNKNLDLEIRDNGKGFDVNQNSSGHYGLLGMHERARLTGGTLAIESNASGTCIQFILGRS